MPVPEKALQFWRRLNLKNWTVPLALLGVVVLAYGIYIPWFGLYGDDWPYLWYYHMFGPSGTAGFVAFDRPYSTWFYSLSTALLGDNVAAYHIFMLVLRWLNAVLLWWVLKMIWPENNRQVTWVALLFAVYPGFRQQPLAVEFILHFAIYDLLLLSFGLMLLSARNARRYWLLTAGGLVCAAGVFSSEYFAGLELLRPFFLAMIFMGSMPWKDLLKKVFLIWLPYLALIVFFFVWRMFIFEHVSYEPVLASNLAASPLAGIADLAVRILSDIWKVVVRAWLQVFSLPDGSRSIQIYALLVIASLVVLGVYLSKLSKEELKPAHSNLTTLIKSWPVSALILGLLALLTSGWPFWVTNIPVELTFPWDRPTISFMLGASLMIVGFIDLLFQPFFRPILAAGLVALALGMHFQNAQEYRNEWQKLRSFFWQLNWRAPGLEKGTILVFDNIPLNRSSDGELTATLNWMYAPDHADWQIPYKIFDLSLRMDADNQGLPGLSEGLPVSHDYRSLSFQSDTSHVLAVHYDPPGCVRILGREDTSLPDLTDRLRKSLVISHPEMIHVDENPPAKPPSILGEEPEHNWCYFFEKADLARQKGDWQQIVDLYTRAENQSLRPKDLTELFPFVEGYAHTGDWERAQEMSSRVGQDPSLTPALCTLWREVGSDFQQGSSDAASVTTIMGDLGCSS
jgi:hypothetical protein